MYRPVRFASIRLAIVANAPYNAGSRPVTRNISALRRGRHCSELELTRKNRLSRHDSAKTADAATTRPPRLCVCTTNCGAKGFIDDCYQRQRNHAPILKACRPGESRGALRPREEKQIVGPRAAVRPRRAQRPVEDRFQCDVPTSAYRHSLGEVQDRTRANILVACGQATMDSAWGPSRRR